LSPTQFLTAYELLISHASFNSTQYETFFEAIRYGRIGDDYIVTVYTGTVDNVDMFQNLVPRLQPERYSGNMESFIRLINEDSINNEIPSKRQNVMWWIDIATSERNVTLIRRIKTTFGLAADTEPYFLENNFNVRDRARYMTGVGVGLDGKKVHSATIGIQTMWLSHRPVVELGSDYMTSRLNIFFRLDSRPDHERDNALSYAEGVAQVSRLLTRTLLECLSPLTV
jgi:hypothetical protein